ncbi:MAG TPA: aldose 1-epimerase [Stellaceae bacterium]|nr:aldose 1-epimerase [Stellaceae bacterium]
MSAARPPGILNDTSARTLVAGDLEALFLPSHGMLCASLRHRGAEILRRVENLEAGAARGSTAGIPLLHPWANRLAGSRYSVAGRDVELDPSSPLLHFDEHGLPIHGVPWSHLTWEVTENRQDSLVARLDWTQGKLLAVFPYRHQMQLAATLRPDGLTFDTTLNAGMDGPVPVSFGFHPYLGLPGLPRAQWRLTLPPMRKLVLDRQGIPTGEEEPFGGFDSCLDERDFDDGFALPEEGISFSVKGAGRRVSVELLAGYRYAQVFAPKDQDYIALEPMTAPAGALTSSRGLRLVQPGQKFRAAFRVYIGTAR